MLQRTLIPGLLGGLLVTSTLLAPLAAASSSMAMTMHLHATKYAPKAMATAMVTQVSSADYRIQVTAEGLPSPTKLMATPKRTAYLLWVIDSKNKHDMMGVVHLKYDSATKNYTANQVVMIKAVSRLIVTADKSAMQSMPTMPEITVLDTQMGAGMM